MKCMCSSMCLLHWCRTGSLASLMALLLLHQSGVGYCCSNPNSKRIYRTIKLSAGINRGSIFYFCWRKRKSLVFLTSPSDRSRSQSENITCSRISIIRIIGPIWISETNQQRFPPCTVMNPKLNCTSNISKYSFCCFPVTFMRSLHITGNMTNIKGKVETGMSQV